MDTSNRWYNIVKRKGGKKVGNKKYTKEFKESVIAYTREYEGSLAEVARHFDVPLGTFYKWWDLAQKHKEEAFVGTGHLRKDDAERNAREKELRELKEENMILKKALAIFSKQ